jgi:serine/threonine protein kinase
MTLQPGDRLGPYAIVSLVGTGGMGEVYKAIDTRLERTVAVKVLPPALSGDDHARRRLAREARVIAGLSHPHICPLFDVGEHNGSDFLVMEYLEARPWLIGSGAAARPLTRRFAVAGRLPRRSPPRTPRASFTET